jgi:hypothetical protein
MKPLVLLASVIFVAACDDQRAGLPVAPAEVAPNAVAAYLAVSNETPSAGERVTVSVRARRGSAVGPIGSFTIRLSYDTTRLRYMESARAERGMVMANGTARGVVKGAGASAEGFSDDELLTSTFLVLTGNDALASLALDVQELNSVQFEDQRANMRVERKLFRGEGRKP